MDPSNLMMFVAASLVVIITPGQDMVLVMSRAVSQGARAGLITASGVSAGLLGHSVVATLGLGALLFASASLFALLKLIGAGYLFYLGIRLVMKRSPRLLPETTERASAGTLFVSGAFSNISNPHITLFYFAFLPQFIPATASDPTWYVLGLGVGFAALAFLVKGPIGYSAGLFSGRIRTHPGIVRWAERVSGVVLIGLGLRLVFEKRI